jgi:hypothetical protein
MFFSVLGAEFVCMCGQLYHIALLMCILPKGFYFLYHTYVFGRVGALTTFWGFWRRRGRVHSKNDDGNPYSYPIPQFPLGRTPSIE